MVIIFCSRNFNQLEANKFKKNASTKKVLSDQIVKSYGYLQSQRYGYNLSKHAYQYHFKLQIKPLPTAVDTCQ